MKETDLKGKTKKELVLSSTISTLYLFLVLGIIAVVITVQGVSDLYRNAQYAQGVVTGAELTRHARYGPATYTLDHTVVSLDKTMQWVIEQRENDRIPDGTELSIIYSSKNPQRAHIWKSEYNVDGKPSLMRLFLEEDWHMQVALFPILIITLLVLHVKSWQQKKAAKSDSVKTV